MMGSISADQKRKWTIAAVLLLLGAWKVASVLVGREIILPSPEATLLRSFLLLTDSANLVAIAWTLGRIIVAFSIDLGAALILGTLAGLLLPLRLLFEPAVTVMKAVPTMGIILLSLIWLDADSATVFVCSLVVFPILYAAVLAGIDHVDPGLEEVHRVFRIPLGSKIRHFYLPTMRPYLGAGVASALGLTMKVMVAAEVLGQPRLGIGTMFQVARSRLDTAGVFAWSLVVIALAGGLDYLLSLLGRRTR
jgi:NitT/TauT family transport system permease protein